jgi:Tol biopolymer transport system component
MLWRACVALAAVIGTLLTTAATRSGGSDTALLLYTTYAGRALELRAISLDGTGARTVVRLAHVPGIYRVALSPDRKILAAQGDGGISTIRLSDGTTRSAVRNGNEFTWSPDSKRIAYCTEAANPQIELVGSDGSGRRRLTHTRPPKRTWATYIGLEWAPNGKRIAFMKWQAYDSRHPPVGSRVATITMSGKQTLLPRVRPFVPASLAWSPSNKAIAAGGFRDAGVMIVRDRGKPQYLRPTSCCVGVGSLAWSPDGTRIAFLGGDTSSSDAGGVIRIGNIYASVFTQFYGAHDPVWARDSRHFAFVGCVPKPERCDIYVSDRDGQEVTPINGTIGAEDLLAWTD